MKNAARFLRDQLLLAQHHLNDAETAPNKQVLDSSLEDTEEMVQRMGKVLPPRDQVTVKAEQHRKEAALAAPSSTRKVPAKDLTMSTADLLKQAADAETVDRANAFELGFAKAAHEAGLDEAGYQAMRKIALAQLEKQAADKGEIAAQPATNAPAVGAATDAPQQEKRESSAKKVKKSETPSAIAGRGCK
jgi:hypothetical protein